MVSANDRSAVVEILRETKNNLPDFCDADSQTAESRSDSRGSARDRRLRPDDCRREHLEMGARHCWSDDLHARRAARPPLGCADDRRSLQESKNSRFVLAPINLGSLYANGIVVDKDETE